jgi:A/G-specific adenine glycosylase
MPAAPDALREIPGIGRYTAGAIASIAHDRPAALVDGNVARVFSRLQAITDPKLQRRRRRPLDARPADRRGRLAAGPRAGADGARRHRLHPAAAEAATPARCAAECLAHALGLVDQIPAPKKRAPSPQQDLWAVGVRRAGKLLLTRRPGEGLLAGMWCLPLIERPPAPPEAPHGSLFDRSRVTPAALRKAPALRVQKIEPARTSRSSTSSPTACGCCGPCRADARPRRRVRYRHRRPPHRAHPPTRPPGSLPGERPVGGIPTVTERLLERLGY